MSRHRAARLSPEYSRKINLCRRAFSVALVLVMLSAQTPAAPPVLKGVASEWRLGAALWLDASGWSATLRGLADGQPAPRTKKQEKQDERDARVARVQLSPAAATVRAGERVVFAALAYDKDGAPVGGVRFKWQALDAERGGRRMRVSRDGVFESPVEGTYTVKVTGVGHEAQATVRVLKVQRGKRGEKPSAVRPVSTRDLPPGASARVKPRLRQKGGAAARRSAASPAFVKASFAHAAAPRTAAVPAALLLPEDGWNQDNYMYADDPGNGAGDPPGSPVDDGAGSGNYQFAAPVLSLPGRGLDLSLALAYNARVWSKTDAYDISFDPDRSWPAPGWSLGFGKIVGMNTGGSMLIDADGTRHGFTGSVTSYNWGGTYFDGHTTDGTFIDFHTYSYQGVAQSGWAKLPNGTYVEYGVPGDGAIYPTRITDANGNYVTVTYRNNQGPRVETVTDTLGRVVQFHYDGYNLLTAVTAPGLGGGARTLVRLHYRQHALSYGFAGLTARVRDAYPWVIDAVYYPATGTGYWFGDGDSYSSYGMIAKVSERRAMGLLAGSLNEQGTVTSAGNVTREVTYSYPLTPNYGLTDAPSYTSSTQTWEGMTTGPAVTQYAVYQNSWPRRTEITAPDGTKSIQLSYNAPGQWQDGLLYQDETRDAAGTLLQSSAVTWEQGAYSSPRPQRTQVTDERGQVTATEFSYGPVYNQVTEVRNYDYGGVTPLRVTRTEYENGANYTGRHIFNLVKSVEVYAGDGATRVSRTEYSYDGAPLANAPGVTMHDPSHDPHQPTTQECYWEEDTSDPDYMNPGCYQWDSSCDGYVPWVYNCYSYNPYNPATDYRGNVTQVKTYADAANLGGAITETRAYDIAGNLRAASSSCCEQTSFGYTLNTQYAYPESQTRGAASDATKQITTSATYDFNTGLVNTTTDANGRLAQTDYDAATLRPARAYAAKAGGPVGAAYTAYDYDDAAMTVAETTYADANGTQVAAKSIKRLNGNGQVRREEALAAGGAWDVVETQYDQSGRAWKQSRPFRDGVEQPRWSTTTYDALGRVRQVEAPDGSKTETFYNEGGYPGAPTQNVPGQTTRVKDAWGRERWGRADAQGRLVEVVEPNPLGGGSVYEGGGLLTSYSYDTLGNLVGVAQGAQTRSFKYDSLGRLTRQKLAETSATINDAGNYVGAGGAGAVWGDAFAYDERSNLVSRTDARGVVTTFSYRDAANSLDPLNRLQSASYAVPAGANIPAAATVSYAYWPSGDKTRLATITTAGVSTETFDYDSEGRLYYRELKIAGRESYPFSTNYSFDSLDRVWQVTYPAQYGVAGAPRKQVKQEFDVAGRASGLQVNGVNYASQINYNAASQTTSLKVGAGAGQLTESYTYDPVTGLLSGQQVARDSSPSTPLLDLTYDYLRAGTSSGRTGQLAKITDSRDRSRDRGYEYDALGRLKRATGGQQVVWAQRYNYDRYGNRQSVFSNTAENWVKNFYQQAPGRAVTVQELTSELNALRSAYSAGESSYLTAARSMGERLFTSQDYLNRNRSNGEYVSDLYRAYLMREPDAGGLSVWTNALNTGSSRESARGGFAYRDEFRHRVSGLSPYSPPQLASSGAPGGNTPYGSSTAQLAPPAEPQVTLPTEQLAWSVTPEIPEKLRGDSIEPKRPVSDAPVSPLSSSSTRRYSAGPTAPPAQGGGTPYGGTPAAIPGTVEVERYDEGGEGVAYHDLDPANQAGSFRPNEGVDAWPGGLGYVQAGEWLNYTVEVAASGTYDLEARVASPGQGGTFHVEFDGVNKTGAISVPGTGGWGNYQTVTKSGVSLTAGRHVVRLVLDTNGPGMGYVGNFGYFRFTAAQTQTPYGGAARQLPGTVQAEDFDEGGEGVAYHDTTPGNNGAVCCGGTYRNTDVDLGVSGDADGSQTIGWAAPGEWLTYTVNVGTAGSYTVEARVASPGGGGRFHIEFDGVDRTGPLTTPDTGDWSVYQTLSKGGVQLSAGQHVMRVVMDSNGPNGIANFNYFRFTQEQTQTPYGGTARQLPGTIQAEDFDEGGEGVSYHDLSPGNEGGQYRNTAVDIGYCGGAPALGWNGGGEWTEYTVDVAATGSYTFQARYGQEASGASLHVEVDGTDVTGAVALPNTGGWCTHQTATKSGVRLTAGRHVIRVVTDNMGVTFDSFSFTPEQGGTGALSPVVRDGWESLAYDESSNRVSLSGWEYDAAGNLVRAADGYGGFRRYEYDAAGRMVRVKTDAGAVIAGYTYGDSRERLVAHEGDTRTYYAGEGGQVLCEYQEVGSGTQPQWAKSYIYLGSRLLATQAPGGAGELVRYHHPDRLGTRLTTNASDGTVAEEQLTLPYGTASPTESTGTPTTTRRFTSYERSSVTGLDYAINRHYDSLQGRFTQVDPIGMAAASLGNPQSLNLYNYCGNDPVNFTDPAGLFSLGGLFRGIARVFGAVFKWAARVAAVLLVALAVLLPSSATIVMAAVMVAFAFGPPAVQRIIGVAGRLASVYNRGLAGVGPGGTAVFNPDAGSGLGDGHSAVARYLLRFQDGEEFFDGELYEVVNTNICRNGNNYPHCGAGWWGLAPVVGPAWDAHDAFRSGRWGWGIAYTAMAVSDVFLVKSIVTAGGRLLARGGTGIVERAMSRAELEATMMTGLASPAPMNIASLVGRPPGVHRVSPDLLVF